MRKWRRNWLLKTMFWRTATTTPRCRSIEASDDSGKLPLQSQAMWYLHSLIWIRVPGIFPYCSKFWFRKNWQTLFNIWYLHLRSQICHFIITRLAWVMLRVNDALILTATVPSAMNFKPLCLVTTPSTVPRLRNYSIGKTTNLCAGIAQVE